MAFSNTDNQDEWKKTIQCHGCRGKGHLLHECKKTPAEKKKNILALEKSTEFKRDRGAPTSSGANNVVVEEPEEELVEEEVKKPTYEDLLELYVFNNVNVEMLLEDICDNYI